jgi:hypothetical protein
MHTHTLLKACVLLISLPFECSVGSVWLVRVIEIGLMHKPYASDGVFERNCNQQYLYYALSTMSRPKPQEAISVARARLCHDG